MKDPQSFADLIGQSNVVETLKKESKTTQPAHTLLYGPPGLGKTTIAKVMAREAGLQLVEIQCSRMVTPKAITKTLMDLDRTGYSKNGIAQSNARRYLVFFDEITELSDTTFLHAPLSSCELNPDPYGGISWLPDTTFFGCTNWPHLLTVPFKSRFPIKLRVEPYSLEDLQEMIARQCPRMKASQLADVARRSRGAARTALDYADLVSRHGIEILDRQGIDKEGLTSLDREYLTKLESAGRPLSLGTISAMVQEDQSVVRKEVEPFLLRIGRIEITPKGRQIVGTAFGGSYGRRGATPAETADGRTEAYVGD